MKYLILILLIFTNFSTFATEVNYTADGNMVYLLERDCLKTNNICYELKAGEVYSDYDIVDEYIDDFDEVLCSAVADDSVTVDIDESKTKEDDCIEKEIALSCDNLSPDYNWYKVRLADNSKVYCTAISGYEKKLSGHKILQINEVKKSERLVKEAVEKSESKALASQMKMLKYGQELIALIGIRNKTKTGLTSTQVLSMVNTYAPIQSLLLSGSLETALIQINSIAVSAEITQEDKDYIISKVNYYLGL